MKSGRFFPVFGLLHILLLGWGAPGCRERGEGVSWMENDAGVVIVRFSARRQPFPDAPPFDVPEEWFARQLETLASSPHLRVALGSGPWRAGRPHALDITWALRPALRIRPLETGQEVQDRAVEVTASARLVPLYPHAPRDERTAVAGRQMTYAQAGVKDFEPRLERQLQEAFSEAMASLLVEVGLDAASPLHVLSALSSRDAATRRAAVEAVRRRRLTAAVPRLVDMLWSEESFSLRMGAAEALAELGDPAAVEPLAEFATLLPPEQTVTVCSWIAAFRTEDARRFLHWTAFGHYHPDVRRAAARLLREILKEVPLHGGSGEKKGKP